MQGVTDIRHKDDINMCNDGRHEECVEMVERSFMPESKSLGMASYPFVFSQILELYVLSVELTNYHM